MSIIFDKVLGTYRESDASAPSGDSAVVYGVIYDPSSSSPVCQKVVLSGTQLIAVDDFAMLPAHDFKRCVMDDLAARHVNYYLNQYDSTKKADGTAADLTGADGDVMVEIPITYWKYQTMNDGKIVYLVSDKMFSGASIHPFFYVSPDGHTARNQYVGAYQSTICDASGARIANMMNQDATASSSYATGYKARSVAGCKPWTSMPQSTHRTAAANNGAQGVNSLFHQYLVLMMLIESGSFDNQSALSVGFSYAKRWMYQYTRISGRANFGNGTGSIMSDPTIDASVCWETIVVNGVTVYRNVPLDANNYYGWSDGSHTYFTSTAVPTNGSTVYTDTAGTDSGYTTTNYSAVSDNLRVVQFSYRGIENPYGEIGKFEDGIQKYQNVVDDALTDGCYWWTAATSLYTDVDQQAAASPTYARVPHAWPATGYVKTWRPDNFLPLTVGGASTTYLCDYFYNDSAAGARVVLRGGDVHYGALAGGGYVHVPHGLAHASPDFGGRLAA